MEKVFNIGIIGVGMMGRFHIDFLRQSKVFKLTALCARRAESFAELAPEVLQGVKCYTDCDEFFADKNIDIVLIATPHRSHTMLAVKALQHNKHLLIEKPPAVHKLETEQLLAEAALHPDLSINVLFNQRTYPAHCKVKELIENNTLGRIQRVNWTATDWFRSQHYFESNAWRATWRGEGGGVLLTQSIHQLDLLQWFFGLPQKVRAIVKLGKYHDIEVEDDVNAVLEYADGKVINFITSTGENPGINRLEIIGENGLLTLENDQLTFRRNARSSSEFIIHADDMMLRLDCQTELVETASKDTLVNSGYPLLFENLLDAVKTQAKLIAPLENCARSLELANAILYAGLKEEVVTLPLDAQKFSGLLDGLVRQAEK